MDQQNPFAQFAKRRLDKMQAKEEPGEIEVEITANPPEPGKPGGGGLDAELDACAKEFGMSRDEVIAEFKQFLADKKAGG